MDKLEFSTTIPSAPPPGYRPEMEPLPSQIPFKVVVIFDDYSERKYKKDFEDFAKYQTKQNLTGESRETWLRFWQRKKEFTYIPYGTFRTQTAQFFSRIMLDLIQHNLSYVISDSLTIQAKVIRDRHAFLGYDYESSDPENACFEIGGRWLLNTIVGPYVYLKKVDFSHIYRIFLHELTHFVDHMKKYVIYERHPTEKIKVFARRRSAYSLNYLYNVLFNLREEGFPDFVARMDSPRFDMSIKGIRQFNAHVDRLIRMTTKKTAEAWYDAQFSEGNLTASGTYTAGRNMCVFIALSLAKSKRTSYTLQVGKQKFTGYDFPSLDALLSSNGVVYVVDLPLTIKRDAIALIQPQTNLGLIRLYERACDVLGISENNRIMTRERVGRLQKEAIAYAKAERAQRLKKKGFASET